MGTTLTGNGTRTKLWRARFVPAKEGFILPREADYTGPPWNPHAPINATTIASRLPCSTP